MGNVIYNNQTWLASWEIPINEGLERENQRVEWIIKLCNIIKHIMLNRQNNISSVQVYTISDNYCTYHNF